MTRNRTAIDLLSGLGVQLMALFMFMLAFVLAAGLTVARYLSVARERMRRTEARFRRRAARRLAA